MAFSLAPDFEQQFFDNNGDPLSGGKVYSYEAGTTTPQATYTDSSGGTPNANPVILDSSGRATIWLDVELSYKFVIKDSNDVTVKTVDSMIGLLTNNSVPTEALQDDCVTIDKIADDAVGADQLRDDAVTDANRAVTTNHIRDSAITLAKIAAAVQATLVPAGVMLPYGGTSAPTSYLLCDGTSYLRADYPALYAAIGTAFGTADSTHFNVPDFRGRFLRGAAGSATTDPDKASRTAMATGGNTGNNVGSIQADAYASHNHNIYGNSSGGALWNLTLPGAYAVAAISAGTGGAYDNVLDASSSPAIQASGGNETRPLNAYVNYIIKT